MEVLNRYEEHVNERKAEGLPPLALTVDQTKAVILLLCKKGNDAAQLDHLKTLLLTRVNPGVDAAAAVKADFLGDIAKGKAVVEGISKPAAVNALGGMLGGYNVAPLVECLGIEDVAEVAAAALKDILLVYGAFEEVAELSKTNKYARAVIESWSEAEWYTKKAKVPEKVTLTVLKVPGETNTDDLSPASEAFTRSDIPKHAQAMLGAKVCPYDDKSWMKVIDELKAKGNPVAFVGDVVGTGSSRKSAVNSVLWHLGTDIPNVPNKRGNCIVIGQNIAPIFFGTCEDSGALPIQCDVGQLENGEVIDVLPYEGKITGADGTVKAEFKLQPNTILEEFRAGGRVPLIIGRALMDKAREFLGKGESQMFTEPEQPTGFKGGYTQAQKIVGMASGLPGVRPGMYCEPLVSTVASQDTTGGMTRDEIKELAALRFEAPLTMQTFCHTAAYPKPADVKLQNTLPQFFTERGGIAMKPGDGVVHTWVNRMALPDTVGTGGDSHTRIPFGLSLPAGSGLVAFAAVTGHMPVTMPESVLVRFKGKLNKGITLRDVVNAIPYFAIKQGLLTKPKKNKINIFNGRILEMTGFPDLSVDQAFELTNATAERSAAAGCIKLSLENSIEYVKSNAALLEALVEKGYTDKDALLRRIADMREWLKDPKLVEADDDAQYAHVMELDLADITEPILACPNDPDDVNTLTEILADPKRPKKIDEVFVGSCMTNVGHFRAAGEILRGEGSVPVRMWIAPPTVMDRTTLRREGYYLPFGQSGARCEVPGCSLCMGNQARTQDNAVVMSTSTRNFNNRIGKGAQVYLGSAELAAVAAVKGRLPSVEQYMEVYNSKLAGKEENLYKYMYFHRTGAKDAIEYF